MKLNLLCSLLGISMLFSNLNSQVDFQNYNGLQSIGSVPADFTDITKEKITKEKKSNQSKKGKNKTDQKIIATTNYAIDRILQKGDVLFNDPVTNYIKDVLAIVLKDEPTLLSELRVYTIKSNMVNAFSTRQGILFVTTGLLSKLQNEAQLAFILAHEVSHYTENHVVKSFEESDKIIAGKGKFKSISEDEKLKYLSRYSKDKEFEADEFGFELFEETAYALSEVETALDLLIYSDLNFTNEKFDRKFFNDGSLYIPESYYPSTINAIEERQGDYDDANATHPNITKRKFEIDKLIDENKLEGQLFIVGKERFEEVRKACQFESIQQHISSGSPAEAIYSASVLLKEYPDNKYLNMEMAKAWYKLIKYSNSDQLSEILVSLDDVEGEVHAVHYMIDRFSDAQLQAVGVKIIYNIYKKYDVPVLKLYYENALESFIHYSEPKWENYLDIGFEEARTKLEESKIIRPDTVVLDSLMKGDEIKKMESIKVDDITKTIPEKMKFEDNFHLHVFADILNSEEFQGLRNKFSTSEKSEVSEVFESDGFQPQTKAERKALKKINRNGAALGIKDLIVLSPEFQAWHHKKGFKPGASEKGNVSIGNTYRKSCDLLDLNYQVLDKKGFSESDVNAVNDLNALRQYFFEVLSYNKEKGYLPTNYDKVHEIIKRRDSKHILIPLVIVEQKKNISKGQWFYLLPPFTPVFFINAFIPKDNVLIANILYDMEANEVEHIFVKYFKSKSSSIPFVQAHIYDIIYQVSREKKGGKK